ncbi:helix-turn-helix transcriptional regulator [Streptomyces sp. NPDC029554]|uniref:helix-turn-helix domain-containing protein n=1 Tax=Streptomyces sp. NPDC029554 TaxID=3155126 RepID=UPI0033D42B78
MTGEPNLLGDFVRARRELVTPEQAGVPVVGVRRVPGLRREEVALLAGISVDYYLRLEQGRDRNPSVQVLEALARVLLLDDDATEHLLALGADRPRRRRRRPARETVPHGVAQLVATLPLPALVEGRYFDVLAANPLATALSPRFTPGANRLRSLFLDPAEQALYPGWEQAAAGMVAGFRQSIGADTDDPRCIELVGELSLASPLFSRLWARHDVVACAGAPKYVDHPQVGGLWLNRERLSVDGTIGQTLVVYHPAPGRTDADSLTLLAATTSGAHQRARAPQG